MKIVGIVPARMAASRFPGKPLYPIHGRPMVEHVFLRAKQFTHWDGLFLATCDEEIRKFGESKNFPTIMTASTHTRCLDRVAEAALKCNLNLNDEDIVVCVQGDEPMLHPKMIEASIEPILSGGGVSCTVLAMPIREREHFENPDVVKIIHNSGGEVLYTSRSPVPYCKGDFSEKHGAKRIYGIFAFRLGHLLRFTQMKETYLEQVESCDSNRILDADFAQNVALYPFKPSFAVDSPSDIALVEEFIRQDELWGTY